ncbi:MAG: OmpA family protein [Luteitalea sp.]|nr:OmpA family protein [Luteitalea sp.]
MRRFKRVGLIALLGLGLATPSVWAQEPQPAPQEPTEQPSAAEEQPAEEPLASDGTRRATTTFHGDSGLWFVPIAEVLPHGMWSLSGYRGNFDRQEGFTDYSQWPVTFGVGVGNRLELFGSFQVVSRIDRDVRPIFVDGNEAGGPVNELPLVPQGWSDNQVGDLYVGGKINFVSQADQRPLAFAVRPMIKLPTGDSDTGASSGEADFLIDAIISGEANQSAELSGYLGWVQRGDPDGLDIANGLRYGFGVGVPSRSPLRLTAELVGEAHSDDVITIDDGALVADDETLAPLVSQIRNPLDLNVGLTYLSANGFFLGGGVSWALAHDSRSDHFPDFEDRTGDPFGFQFRIGYHPGVRAYAPPPPAPEPIPEPPANRPPTVKARCEPCTVEVGKSSTVTCDGQDPDGDPLTYKWSGPAGTFASPGDRQSLWTAPMQEGPVPVTCTVDDGKGGTATDTVTIQVVKPTVEEIVFEDVHFDFDRYTLRPEATRILDEAVTAMQKDETLRLEIEGHTCNIGTAEYNLALGDRRARAVSSYLASRGIGADRLKTVTYGEERPKHDNAREETRRLNRRAALIARLTQ